MTNVLPLPRPTTRPRPCTVEASHDVTGAKVVHLRRCIFRKIVVQRSGNSWVAMIVGFDPRFFTPVVSQAFATREEARAAAAAGSATTGLPVITIETLADGGPERAA